MREVDLKKELKQLYQASAKEVQAVEVPALRPSFVPSSTIDAALSDIRRAAPAKWKTIRRAMV